MLKKSYFFKKSKSFLKIKNNGLVFIPIEFIHLIFPKIQNKIKLFIKDCIIEILIFLKFTQNLLINLIYTKN